MWGTVDSITVLSSMGCPVFANLDDTWLQCLVLADVIGRSHHPAVCVGRCCSLEKEGSQAHPQVFAFLEV